jgi:hypothetical protein
LSFSLGLPFRHAEVARTVLLRERYPTVVLLLEDISAVRMD